MKKIVFPILLIGLLSACQSNKEGEASSSTITLNTNVLQMTVGEMQTLTATTTATPVTWTSTNDSIATVYMGYVTAIGVGNTKITATNNAGVSANCVVYVKGKNGESLAVSPALMQLEKGEEGQAQANAVYDIELTWASTNENVAVVDQNGHITAVGPGHTFVTVTNGLQTCTTHVIVPHHWGEYALVWEENFDGNSLDENTWNIEVNGSGGGNKEAQYYTDRTENLRVEDGCLVIEARKETYNNKEYTSARINSRDKVGFKYGKIEASISFPAGGGTWPAFWMMGQDYRTSGWPSCGEIDIIEHVGNQPRMLSFAVHTPKKNGTYGNNWSSRSYFDGVENAFHTYGIEWIEEDLNGCDRIIFTYDGIECAGILEPLDYIDQNAYWPFNKEHFIILNMAIGGTMGGTINDDIFDNPVLMKVDWVRVYQHQEAE